MVLDTEVVVDIVVAAEVVDVVLTVETVDVAVVVAGAVEVVVAAVVVVLCDCSENAMATLFPVCVFPDEGDGSYVEPDDRICGMLNCNIPFVDCMAITLGAVAFVANPPMVTYHCTPIGNPDSVKLVMRLLEVGIVVVDAVDVVEAVVVVDAIVVVGDVVDGAVVVVDAVVDVEVAVEAAVDVLPCRSFDGDEKASVA